MPPSTTWIQTPSADSHATLTSFTLDHLSVIALGEHANYNMRRGTVADDRHTVIVYYDHLITFDSEYRYIWKRLGSPSSWLFLINRYFAFLSVRLK